MVPFSLPIIEIIQTCLEKLKQISILCCSNNAAFNRYMKSNRRKTSGSFDVNYVVISYKSVPGFPCAASCRCSAPCPREVTLKASVTLNPEKCCGPTQRALTQCRRTHRHCVFSAKQEQMLLCSIFFYFTTSHK